MNLSNLRFLGLSPGEIRLYQILLEQGPLAVHEIIALSDLKKGDIYNKLYTLKSRGLLEEFNQNKKKHFRITDPQNLEKLALSQYQTAAQGKQEISAILPLIISTYTLAYGKPGVVVFEGKPALKRIHDDAIAGQSEILQYVDIAAVMKLHRASSDLYARKRQKIGKVKRMLLPDSPVARDYGKTQDPKITPARFIKAPGPAFDTVMQIYDNKISYLTLKPQSMIGVIIEDANIARLQRGLFEALWRQAAAL